MEINKTKILIVDDSLDTINIVKSKIQEDKKFEVVGTAQNMRDAYNLIKENKPDVVITEIVLKGEDGFELMEVCSQTDEKAKFFVLSSLSQETFHIKFYKRSSAWKGNASWCGLLYGKTIQCR